jgi:hypothetical protein
MYEQSLHFKVCYRLVVVAVLVLSAGAYIEGIAATDDMLLQDPPQNVIYVDCSAVGGANDGSCWSDAYLDLQEALGDVQEDDEICVAQGVYRPTVARQS